MPDLKKLIATHWNPLPTGVRRLVQTLFATVLVLVIVLATTQNPTQGSVNLGLGAGDQWTKKSASNLGSSTSANTVADSGTSALTTHLVVQVVGFVAKPGVYELSTGARVLDAVFAAGGFVAHADQASVNLARPINDGEQIQILGKTGTPYAELGITGDTSVNINLADASKLDSLPGIGPTLAQRIVDFRTSNGGFRSIADLGKVAGIGPSLLKKLKDLVTL